MYCEKQQERIIGKLVRFEETLERLTFTKIDEISMKKYQTKEPLDTIPDESLFTPCEKGEEWGGEGMYCWYKGTYEVPGQYAGQNLYLRPHIGYYEAMLWVNGVPHGIYTTKITFNSHGNHHCDRIRTSAKAGEKIDLALECYAYHYMLGTQPFQDEAFRSFMYTYNGAEICVKNEDICDVYFNLKTVNQMVKALPQESFRRADLIRTLLKINEFIYYDYELAPKDAFFAALQKANGLLKAELAKKNGPSAPSAGLIGHSHMDTQWLWPLQETLKKCARTYSNQMNLMEQYPDYIFVQSSAFHSQMIKEHYPALFEQIKERVKEGRYEPNGGAYIECDCNIPSGESMIRQFVWGQRFNKENFDYRSDCFWLPDTFGYSAALPQIMKGCGIDYFLTTKMDWNDTNRFPYDTFYWKGIDGTKVLSHLNKSHLRPDPETLIRYAGENKEDSLCEKPVTSMRLFSYGFGDGGGGPEYEMIEMAKRVEDTEGVPKAHHTTVSAFMHQLEENIEDPSIYSGELYLELHRGTLTNQHEIKRNNRLAETALHNLEYGLVRKGIREEHAADTTEIRPLWQVLLRDQFHDVLPGTCIPRVHEATRKEVTELIAKARNQFATIEAEAAEKKDTDKVYVTNTLSFARKDVFYLEAKEGYHLAGNYRQQIVTDVNGKRQLAVAGCEIPAFSTIELSWIPGEVAGESVFTVNGDAIEAPHERILLNEKRYIDSYVDLEENRELRGEGYALNTLLFGEEVSAGWDNWDVDVDMESRLGDRAELLSSEIISDGPVELRIRNHYKLTDKSDIKQDMIVYADTKEVRFETRMNWQEEHRFLKAAFDTTIFTDTARQEVQFGYIKRPTTRNDSFEKAKFEVSNHKYTNLSETRYGASVLNDCKYGISVKDSGMHLSLHKGGNRPDFTGDKGSHYCEYSFLPYQGAFGAENVIRPAFCLNVKPVVTEAGRVESTLASVDADHIIIDTVKPSEDGGRAFVLRLYEAEGTAAETILHMNVPVVSAELTNMLEETEEVLGETREVPLHFRAFEIKTVKIYY